VHDRLGVGQQRPARCIDRAADMIGMQMRRQHAVDGIRRHPHGGQVLGQPAERRPHEGAASAVHQDRPFAEMRQMALTVTFFWSPQVSIWPDRADFDRHDRNEPGLSLASRPGCIISSDT
jgi:hypothetical protein